MINKTKFQHIIIILFFWVLSPSIVCAASIGDKKIFSVDPVYQKGAVSQINATLNRISNYTYVYVEDGWYYSLSEGSQISINNSIDQLAQEFDINIRPKMIGAYGSEWSPGIDNDVRLTILVTQIVNNAGGYFNSGDEYFKQQNTLSNEREIIYLNSSYIQTANAKSYLAHEFQHMITFYQKKIVRGYDEDIWLNESRSEYAPTLLGYDAEYSGSDLERRISNFMLDPSDSLTEWKNATIDYSSINLFMQYLVEHFGIKILRAMISENSTGIASINKALKSLGSVEKFSDIFVNWSVANYINNCTINSSRYCYTAGPLKTQGVIAKPSISYEITAGTNISVSGQNSLKDWSSKALMLFSRLTTVGVAPNILKVEITLPSDGQFSVPYILEESKGSVVVKNLEINNGKGIIYITKWGSKNLKINILPIAINKQSDFGNNELSYKFSYSATLVNELTQDYEPSPTVVFPNYPDGSVLRAKGDIKVYIIKNGKYKRWIQNPEIFNLYGHLTWSSIIDVEPAELGFYQEASLIRAGGDKKVYEINGDGTKHWVDMTSVDFISSGRAWDMVYIVNQSEINLYKTGGNVRK